MRFKAQRQTHTHQGSIQDLAFMWSLHIGDNFSKANNWTGYENVLIKCYFCRFLKITTLVQDCIYCRSTTRPELRSCLIQKNVPNVLKTAERPQPTGLPLLKLYFWTTQVHFQNRRWLTTQNTRVFFFLTTDVTEKFSNTRHKNLLWPGQSKEDFKFSSICVPWLLQNTYPTVTTTAGTKERS